MIAVEIQLDSLLCNIDPTVSILLTLIVRLIIMNVKVTKP